MGSKMKEKMIGIQKMLAKKWVRRFLGITLLVLLVGMHGLHLLWSAAYNFFTVKCTLLTFFTGVFNFFKVQWNLLAVLAWIMITAVLLAIWVFNIGWYSVWYRYLVLGAAKVVGFLVRNSRSYMKRIILYMIILGFLIAVWQWLLPEAIPVPKPLAWITFDLLLKILVVFVITKIYLGAFKLRKQIVFEEFKNLTGETSFDVPVEAIQEVLINRFNYLEELIYTIDEINPKSQDNKMPSPTINVSGAVDSLKSLDLSGQKIKVGTFFEIPLGFIVSALRSILKGPMLTGSLHRRGNDLELIARMSGRRFSGNWRVNIGDLDEEEKKLPEKDRLEKMIEHLCCMIFTRLVSVGSDRWKAVHRYTEGLRDYRQTSKKEKGKNIQLRQAEKAFIDALNEDKSFVMCRFNLGVVYEELGQYDSAEVAFREVLKKDHENADAYFSLGINYFYKGKYEDAFWYAEQAIRLKPGDSRYWNMKGVIYDYICDYKVKEINKIKAAKNELKENEQDIKPGENNEKTRKEKIIASINSKCLISFHVAVKLSWKNLCWAILKGEDNLRLKNIARVCLCNLALMHDYRRKYRKKRLFKQSIAVSCSEGKPYFELGKIFFRLQDWGKALSAFDRVFEEDSTLSNSIAYWSLYVYACKKQINKKKYDYETIFCNAKYHLLDAISERLGEFLTFLLPRDINKNDDKTGTKKLEILEQDIHDKKMFQEFDEWIANILKAKLSEEDVDLALELTDEVDKWLQEEELWPVEKKEGVNKQADENKKKEWSAVQIDIFIVKGVMDKKIKIMEPHESGIGYKERAKNEIYYDCINRLEAALEKLEDNHEREIRTHRLYGLLAECYLNSVKYQEREKREEINQKALFYARKAVEIDPFSAEDRELLSRVYFKLNDYDQAFNELKNCLSLAPNDLEILRYIPAIRNWDRVFFYDPERRKENFKSLCEFLEEGLRQIKAMVFNGQAAMDSFEYINSIYYKLGSFHRKLKNYDDAIDYLKIAGTIGGRDALKAKLELGWTYMEARAYNKAEQVFAELYNYNIKFYPIEVGLGLAAARIERTISANGVNDLFDYPDELLEEVKERLVESENNTRLKSTIKRELPRYWAQYYGCLGRIAIKQEDTENAVKHFEDSVSGEGSSWGYYFLAEAYYRRSQEIRVKKQLSYLERAQDACIMSGNFDKKGLYIQEMTALKQKITGDIERLKTQENTKKGGK